MNFCEMIIASFKIKIRRIVRVPPSFAFIFLNKALFYNLNFIYSF